MSYSEVIVSYSMTAMFGLLDIFALCFAVDWMVAMRPSSGSLVWGGLLKLE